MLVEEHQVLHRDISWGNVLINATHTGKGQQDDLCGRPFIDTMMNVKYVPQSLNGHTGLELMLDTVKRQERSMLCCRILIVHVSLEVARCVSLLLEARLL